MAVDFRSLLSKPIDSAERPKALPAGTYYGTVDKYEYGESKEKKTPYVRFNVKVSQADASVEPSLLAGIDLSKKQLRKDFYITAESDYRLADFIKSCGVETAGRGFDQGVPECVGAPVILEVTQRQQNDDTYNDIGKMFGTANPPASAAVAA